MLIWAVIYVLILISMFGLIIWLSKYETPRKHKPSKTTLFHVLYSIKVKNTKYLFNNYRN